MLQKSLFGCFVAKTMAVLLKPTAIIFFANLSIIYLYC